MSACYIDTSALAKWYINEPGSEAVAAFLRDVDIAVISRLTMTEMRCLLARRRRAGDFDIDYELAAHAQFKHDTAAGRLTVQASNDAHFIDAAHLIERLDPLPLRTLDAIHLAIARAGAVDAIATADGVMAAAAERLGLRVSFFGSQP